MKFYLSCFLVWIGLIFFPCVGFPEIPADLQKIISNKKIIIALNSQDYPPYFYQNERHELDGFDVTLAKDIAKSLGVKLEFNRNAKSFNEVVQEVEQGKADLGMGAISATPNRGLYVNFSQPYLMVKQVLIVNRLLDMKVENALAEGGWKDPLAFGASKDSAYETAFHDKFFTVNKYSENSKLIAYDRMETAFKDVLSGKIYAFYTDEAYANYLFEKNKKAHLYVKKNILSRQFDPITIAVSWKNPGLLNWIDLYIQSIKFDGTEDLFIKKYLKGL